MLAYDCDVKVVCGIVALLAACQNADKPAPLRQVTAAELPAHRGERVQVQGVVANARRTERGVEFTLVDRDARVPVLATTIVPDRFRDGIEVEVRGLLSGDTLVTDDVLALPPRF